MSAPANIGDVLSRLTHVKQTAPNEWQADCPCEGHKTPAGHIHITDAGDKALVTCHPNGTHTYEEICKALGFDSLTYSTTKPPPRRIVKVYDYHDEDGNLLFQTVRYEPKDFRQRHKNGSGEDVYDLKGIRRVLYQLPLIRAAIEQHMPVYVTEGEKDADTLMEAGKAATTNPMGAGNWLPEYSEMLRGADIIICGDNDTAGEKHIAKVIASVKSEALSVKVMKVPAPYKDISEWWVSEGTRDKLDALSNAAVEPSGLNVEQPIPQAGSLARVRSLLESTVGWIDYREIDSELCIRTPEDKSNRRMSIQRLKQQDLVESDPMNDRKVRWRHTDDVVERITDGVAAETLPVAMPLGLDKLINITPRNVIVLGGFTGAGKTALMLNIVRLNLASMPIRYLYSEGTLAGLRLRIDTAWPNEIDQWLCVAWRGKTEFFDDALYPDAINIIDWLGKISEFWTVTRDVQAIQGRLTKGIAVIGMQKNADVKLPVGGRFAIERADLYISLDKVNDYYRAIIQKARQWADNQVNPEGLCRYFKLHDRTRIEPTSDWKPFIQA